MNRTLLFSAAALIGATAIGAAVASTLFGEARITTTNAPGLASFPVTAPHHDRRIDGVIWYPSMNDGQGRIVAENGVFYGVEASRDATFDEGTYPLVVLSHGMGGHHRTMSWLASDLAAQGAIVVAVNHPNSSWGDFDLAAGIDHWTRAQDISATLDAVMADATFANHIDETRIMAAGFSYGGWTALSVAGVRGDHMGYVDHCTQYRMESSHCNDLISGAIQLADLDSAQWNASYADPRFTHIVAVDPGLIWGLKDADVAEVTAQVRLMALGDGDDRLLATDFDQSGFADLLPDAQINRFAPASHFMFLPLCKPEGPALLLADNDDPVCTDPVGSNRQALHDDIIELIATDLGL